jgi:hypothetical protein
MNGKSGELSGSDSGAPSADAPSDSSTGDAYGGDSYGNDAGTSDAWTGTESTAAETTAWNETTSEGDDAASEPSDTGQAEQAALAEQARQDMEEAAADSRQQEAEDRAAVQRAEQAALAEQARADMEVAAEDRQRQAAERAAAGAAEQSERQREFNEAAAGRQLETSDDSASGKADAPSVPEAIRKDRPQPTLEMPGPLGDSVRQATFDRQLQKDREAAAQQGEAGAEEPFEVTRGDVRDMKSGLLTGQFSKVSGKGGGE